MANRGIMKCGSPSQFVQVKSTEERKEDPPEAQHVITELIMPSSKSPILQSRDE